MIKKAGKEKLLEELKIQLANFIYIVKKAHTAMARRLYPRPI